MALFHAQRIDFRQQEQMPNGIFNTSCGARSRQLTMMIWVSGYSAWRTGRRLIDGYRE